MGRLILEPVRQRIQVHRWEALADGMMDDAVLPVQEGRWPKELQIDWRSKYPSLLRHAEKLFKLPPFEATVPQR
ncbi:MAG: hypothetical protein HY067_08745 [Betaproteobacteria bacterium]|nr:hypothetical protein [Betaproteobacteria bacterium]